MRLCRIEAGAHPRHGVIAVVEEPEGFVAEEAEAERAGAL
jgi:hypothetical protein